MAEPTLWALGEHTPGKHLVLRQYLNAWFPILGLTQDRIIFIDGFAGPGEYEGGEPGSPIVALRALIEHPAAARLRAEVIFYFIDSDPRRTANLRRLVDAERVRIPPNCRIDVEDGKFDDTMTAVLDAMDAAVSRLAPAFVMIDPFGVSGTPMGVVGRILHHPKSEVYVSFMYEAISRFRDTPEFGPHLDQLFGTPDWRDGVTLDDPDAKKQFFFDLYRRKLKASGAGSVIHFELYKGNRLIYAIFFATKHRLGCDRMKQAIWKVAPFGDFAFRGGRGGQLTLGVGSPDLGRFADELRGRFGTGTPVRIEQLTEFAQSDETDFHSGHVKPTLKILEENGEISVVAGSRKRRNTYPGGTRLQFNSTPDTESVRP